MITLHDRMEYLHLLVRLCVDGDRQTMPLLPGDPMHIEAHDSVIYTVLHVKPFMRGIEDGVWDCLEDHESELRSLTWSIAEYYPSARYWMFAVLLGHSAEAVAARHACAFDPENGSFALCSIAKGDDFVIPWAPGDEYTCVFHFLAVPEAGKADSYLRELLANPDMHPGEIGGFCCRRNVTYQESLFEVKPFGDLYRRQMEISVSPPLNRADALHLLKEVYDMPQGELALTPQEFRRWEEGELNDRARSLRPDW